MKSYNQVQEYLDYLYPNPKCELNYFNDYSLLIAIMLSSQTKDSRVNKVTKILFDKYKDLESLSKANIKDIKNIIYELGNYNKKASNIIEISKLLLEKYNGKVPQDREILSSFPGVGRKTTNVFLSEYYNIPTIAVDTHVERVSKRLNLVKKDSNVLEVEQQLMKNIDTKNYHKFHKQMVLFGRYHCKSKNPECDNCKLKDICKRD